MSEHPMIQSARELAPTLRAQSAAIEAARRVPAELSRELGARGFYRMLVPSALGGGEVAPSVFATVLEEIAKGDSAAAWVCMTGATTGLLLAYLEPAAALEILDGDPTAALAGVFAPTGRAVPVEGGYTLSGRWAFGSGCENAAWRMGGALVFDGGAPRMTSSGQPELRSFFYRAEDSEVLDTWNVSGLEGTGSHDLVVEEAHVRARHTTSLLLDAPRHDGPLYRFPAFGLLATGVSTVGLGIARAALDAMIERAASARTRGGQKTMAEGELVQVTIATAEGELCAARALLHATLDEVYAHASGGGAHPSGALTDTHKARLRLAATHAATVSARVVDSVYHLAGGAAIWSSSPFQRHFRDVHVMTQHVMVGQQTLKPVGRILMGLPTDTAQL